MILRRLTENVKSQNWFAVVLDFIIVVLGILIAFQITNWSTERAGRQVYDEALERVVAELRRDLAMQEWVREGIATELPVIQSALEDLRACRTGEAASANIEAAMTPLFAPYTLLVDTAAVDQFLNNDAFLRYQKPEERKQLTRFLSRAVFYQNEDGLRNQKLLRLASEFPEALSLGPLAVDGPDDILEVILSDSPLSPPIYREPTLTLPLDEACKDKDFVAMFYDWEFNAFQVSIMAGVLEPRIRSALAALGQKVPEEGEAQ